RAIAGAAGRARILASVNPGRKHTDSPLASARGDVLKETDTMHSKDHPSAWHTDGRAPGINANGKRLRVGLLRPLTPTAERVNHDLRASHPEYPIERTCKHRHERFQLAFARRVERLLHERDDLELLP